MSMYLFDDNKLY